MIDNSIKTDSPAKSHARKRIEQTLWKRLDISWKLESHQKKAYERITEAAKWPNNRFVLNASRRWGKTVLMCVLAVEHALKNPGSMILYVGATQKSVKDMTTSAFQLIFSDAPVQLRAEHKTATNQYMFPNGSIIKVCGLDGGRLQKLRGITAHLVIIDEAGFIDKLQMAVLSVLFPMTSTTGGQMILCSNAPLSPGHDFVQVFTREAETKGFYLKQTILDAPKFTKEEVDRFAEACGGYDSSTFLREYMCKFTVDESSAVVPEWNKYKEHLIRNDIKRPEFFYPLVSIDLGLVDFTAVLFGYWNFSLACGVIEDELLLVRPNSASLVKACKAKELELWGEMPLKPPVRVADGAAFTVADISSGHKYPVSLVMKDNVEAQANAIRLDVQNLKLMVHPKCVNLIGQLEDATWDKNRKSFSRDKTNGHFDLVAALQYWVRHVNRHSNPFPKHYNLDVRNMVLHDDKINDPSLESLRKLWAPKTSEKKTQDIDSMARVFADSQKELKKGRYGR